MKRFTRIPFLFCVGGVFALYARCILFSFIGLDDAAYTFRNPFVAEGLSVANVVEAFTNLRHGGIWMPITYVSYMLDSSICRWTGLPLIGEMHFVNVLLHVVNFMLLWKLLCKLFGASALERTRWTNGTTETTGTDGTTDNQQPTIAVTAASRPFGTRNQLSTINYQLSTGIAALTAMIWAVHPLCAEPVAWIAARKELLWTFFTLSGIIFWIRGMRDAGYDNRQHTTDSRNDKRQSTCRKVGCRTDRRSPNVESRQSSTTNYQLSTINYQLSTLICCALACLSKPTAMCFPFLLLLVTWWMRKEDRRVFSIRDETIEVPNNPQSTTLFPLPSSLFPFPSSLFPLLSFLLAAATAAIAAYSQTHVAGQDVVALYAAPISHRLVNALSAIGYYLRVTFCPFGLHVDCRSVPGLWPLDAGWNFAALAIAAVAAFLCWIKGRGLIIFSALWFLISLSPTLGIFGSFGVEAHADRFAYLPLMAFSFLLAGLLRKKVAEWVSEGVRDGGSISTRSTRSTRLKNIPTTNYQLPTIIVIALLSLLTFQQLSYWRDDWAAHRRVLDCDSGHPRAMVHVADARCSRQRDFDGGIRLYRKALSLAGTVPSGGFNVADVKARLAYALASRGGCDDFAEVKKLGAEVLQDFRLDRRGMMLDALGTAFMAEGDAKRAALLFKASIEAPDRFWPKASTRRKLERCR